MKNFALIASVAAMGLIVGCASNKSSASAGAVGEKKAGCCAEGAAKTECTNKDAAKSGSMGAVGQKKDGCCQSKTAQ